MANDVSRDPLIIDTAAAADVLNASQPIKVAKFRWDGPTTAADAISVTDSAGRVVFSYTNAITNSVTVQATNPEADHFPPFAMLGLKVPTMTRGKLYVFLSPGG